MKHVVLVALLVLGVSLVAQGAAHGSTPAVMVGGGLLGLYAGEAADRTRNRTRRPK